MNLKNVNHINKFRRLPIPKNEMLIAGSGVLALLGIRENNDLDIWTTKRITGILSNNVNFIKEQSMIENSDFIYKSNDGVFEFFDRLPLLDDTLEEQMKRSIMIYGINFQSPEDLLKWKKLANRPKDKSDIEQLENYLKNNLIDNYLNAIQSLK